MTKTMTLALVLAASACGASEPLKNRATHVETHATQGPKRVISGASASAVIHETHVDASLKTGGLTNGHVYTLWFVAVNNPDACASSPCTSADVLKNTDVVEADVRWAAGAIAGPSGDIEFAGRVETGPWTNGWFGRGLTNPAGAEIHFVVNDHGPVIEGREQAMKSSYRDGCTDESLPPPFPSTAKSDGEAGPNKCALVQDAIFVLGN